MSILTRWWQKLERWFKRVFASDSTVPVPPSPAPAPSPPDGSEAEVVPEPAPAPIDGDALDLHQIAHWIIPNTPGVTGPRLIGARVTAKISAAFTNGTMLYTSYEPYDFPEKDGTDAVCYLFYRRDGAIVGGKFDWWRPGGQRAKTLENVHHGYGGHVMPARGTEAWTMISSKDGSQRSNTCLVTWS